MEGWFPLSRGEHKRKTIAMRWTCLRTKHNQRAARNSSVAARTERRAQRLDSRPSSQNGSRRPDRRICGERGSAPCDPTLWNAKQASFSAPPLSTFLTNSPRRGENGPYWELECPVECARHGRARSALRPARYSPPHASSAWKPVDGTRYWALQASPLTGSKRPFSSTGNRIGCPGYTSGRTFEFFTTRVPFTTT